MFKKSNVKNRLMLLSTTSLAGAMLMTASALAQDDVETIADTSDAIVDAENEDRIVVTGSRIVRNGFAAAQPVTVLGAEDLSFTGGALLGDVLTDLPSIGSTANFQSNNFGAGTGLNLLDLRRLGVERTLVLQDGRRHVASQNGTSAVDVATIPVHLIERIEVLTGGASAIYGADAVTGVVNFVMKDDFEGVVVDAQYGDAHEGSAGTYFVRGTAGANFDDDRGNVYASVEFSRTNRIDDLDRSFRREGVISQVTTPAGSSFPFENIFITNPGIPVFPTVASTFSFLGRPGGTRPANDPRFPGGGTELIGQFVTEDGDLVDAPFGGALFQGVFTEEGPFRRTDAFRESLRPENERILFAGGATYDLTDWASLYTEAKYVRSTSLGRLTPFFNAGFTVLSENAFLSDATRTFLSDQGASSFRVAKVFNDLDSRVSDVQRETFRWVAGLEGDIPGTSLTFDASWVYGQTENSVVRENVVINDRFDTARDAIVATAAVADLDPNINEGDPICRVTAQTLLGEQPTFQDGTTPAPDFAVDGCQPLNPFGANGVSRTPLGADFITTDTNRIERLVQNVVNLTISGDSEDYFSLPGGPIGFAIGGEYREERSSTSSPAIDRLDLTFNNVILPTRGEFDVWEYFAEVSVPVLRDVTFGDTGFGFQELTLDAAVRRSDYSSIGTNTTWKAGGIWQVSDDLRFRGTYSRAVRAPNVTELFGAPSQTFLFFNDPCSSEFIDNPAFPNRRPNCDALGVPAGYTALQESNTPGTILGNPNLNEERARTFTAGGVFTPTFLDGFSLSVDYWNIDLVDAIDRPGIEDVLNRCVDGPTLNATFCDLIDRATSTSFQVDVFEVVGFRLAELNLAALTAAGVDWEVSYQFDVPDILGLFGPKNGDLGTMQIRQVGTHLLQRRDFPSQEELEFFDPEHGELGDPEWEFQTDFTWRFRDLTVNYQVHMLSPQFIDERETILGNPNFIEPQFQKTDRVFYHDIQGRYQLTDSMQVYAGINNFTDVEPPFGFSGRGVGSAIFDTVGRFYYGGVQISF